MNIPGERYEYEMNMLMYAKNYDIEIIEETIETVYIEENILASSIILSYALFDQPP